MVLMALARKLYMRLSLTKRSPRPLTKMPLRKAWKNWPFSG